MRSHLLFASCIVALAAATAAPAQTLGGSAGSSGGGSLGSGGGSLSGGASGGMLGRDNRALSTESPSLTQSPSLLRQNQPPGVSSGSLAPDTTGAEAASSLDRDLGASGETTGSIGGSPATGQGTVGTIDLFEPTTPLGNALDVDVGTVLPQGAALQPVPERFAEIVPMFAGHSYVSLADGSIAVVEPESRQVQVVIRQ